MIIKISLLVDIDHADLDTDALDICISNLEYDNYVVLDYELDYEVEKVKGEAI